MPSSIYILRTSTDRCGFSSEVAAAKPNEKNILRKILILLKLNIQLIFVADGKNRPAEKYGGQNPWYKHRAQDDTLLKETVTSLGVKWHEAPGEAEAECSAMQSRGVVDAVWTEDSDAFMFGATLVIRFGHSKNGNVDINNVIVYRADKIQKKFSGLTRDGLVLFAVLKGGDYSKNGKSLTNCGAGLALKIATAKEEFGKELCNASVSDFPAWRNRLREYLTRTQSRVEVPDSFPDPRIFSIYNKPLVSSNRILSDISHSWDPSFNEMRLQRVIAPNFNFWVAEYIKHIIPILLIRSLASTKPGQEASNNCYRLKVITKKHALQKNVEVLLSAVTMLDIPTWKRDFENKGMEIPGRVKCEGMLSCIIEHGTHEALSPVATPCKSDMKVATEVQKGKKRVGSPTVPSNIPRSSEEQPPQKRAKSNFGTLEKYQEKYHRVLAEPNSNRAKPKEHQKAQPSTSSMRVTVKKPPEILIDLTCDSSDEMGNVPSTHTRTTISTSSRSSQTVAARQARHHNHDSGNLAPASIPIARKPQATPYNDSQSMPLAEKALPLGITEDDLEGFFSDSSF